MYIHTYLRTYIIQYSVIYTNLLVDNGAYNNNVYIRSHYTVPSFCVYRKEGTLLQLAVHGHLSLMPVLYMCMRVRMYVCGQGSLHEL